MAGIQAVSRAAAPRLGAAALSDRDRFLMFVLDAMAYDYETRYDDVIRMTLGKSELPPEPPVVEAMLSAAADPRAAGLVHPAGLPLLRERLARYYREELDVDAPADRFVVSTGTSTLFRNIYQLVADPGDEVVVPLPYYPLYVVCARILGITVRHYRVDPRTMAVDFASLAAAVTDRTRVVVVNSPGNPLGNLVGADDFRRVDATVDGRALIVSDEIYRDVQFDAPGYTAAALAGLRSPVVVTNAFSKGHRMYARRVGYALVPPELVEPLTVLQHHTLLTTDPVPQFGAVAALDRPADVQELTRRYRARRDYTVAAFAAVDGVDALSSAGGFYLTLDCAAFMAARGIGTSLELAEDIMRERHVATVPGADFGLPRTLRLSYTTDRYDEGVDRLVAYFTAAP